jgi:hypothetical protein
MNLHLILKPLFRRGESSVFLLIITERLIRLLSREDNERNVFDSSIGGASGENTKGYRRDGEPVV